MLDTSGRDGTRHGIMIVAPTLRLTGFPEMSVKACWLARRVAGLNNLIKVFPQLAHILRG